MSTSARRRLLRDFRRLQNDPPSGVTGAPMDTNIMLWQAVIFGPDDTPWEGGTFKLVLEFTEDYPNKAPTVRFLTKMFHPNIYNDGQICLDILQNQWSPIYDISVSDELYTKLVIVLDLGLFGVKAKGQDNWLLKIVMKMKAHQWESL